METITYFFIICCIIFIVPYPTFVDSSTAYYERMLTMAKLCSLVLGTILGYMVFVK